MSGRRRVLAAFTASLPLVAVGWAPVDAARPAQEAPVLQVQLDRSHFDAGPGQRLSFTSTIRNTGAEAQTDLVAHLSILTTDASVYVDPEDWSPKRTQYVDELPAGDSVELDWTVQAVTSGPIVLYVSVNSAEIDATSSSPPLEMTVGGQRVVEAGRVLPLVLWMPVGVLALLGAVLLRRRRHR